MQPTIRTAILACLVLTASTLPAQDPGMAPPDELKRLEPLLGSWTGKGMAYMGPDAPGSEWTSTHKVQKIMNGHFLMEEMTIEMSMGPDQSATLAFVSFMGWDAEKETYTIHSISNMGKIERSEVHWIDDKTMVSMQVAEHEGQQVLSRWTTTLGDGKYELLGEEAVGGGPFFVHVKGTATRVDEDKPVNLDDIGAFMATPSPEMKRAARMAGSYTVTGKWCMDPSQGMTPFKGEEVIEPIFGGTVLRWKSRSTDPEMPYEGLSAMVWDAGSSRYRLLEVSSMGYAGMSEGFWSDGRLVCIMSNTMQGKPFAGRWMVSLDDAGHPTSSVGHCLCGTAEPFVSFQSTYEAKDSGN